MADEASTQSTAVINTSAPTPDQSAPPPAAEPAAAAPQSGDSQASESTQERTSRIGDFFRSFLTGAPEPDAAPVSDQSSEESAPSQQDDSAQQQPAAGDEQRGPKDDGQSQAQPADETFTLTKAELERLVQSSVDKETSRRQTVAQQRAAEEERRRKRREDPIGYAQDEEEREQQITQAQATVQQQLQSTTQTIHGLAEEFDKGILHPLFAAVPEAKRAEIYGQGPVGIDGRSKFVQDSLAAISAHHRAEGAREGEQRVLQRIKSDQGFRKQLYHEFRGESPEPLSAPAATPSGNGARAGGQGDPLRALLQSAPSESGGFP